MDQKPKRKRCPHTSSPGPDTEKKNSTGVVSKISLGSKAEQSTTAYREDPRVSASSQINSIQSAPSTSPLKAISLEASPANALVVMTNSDHDMKALVLGQRGLMLSQDDRLALFQQKLTSLRVLLPDNTTVSVFLALDEQTDIKDIIHETFLKHQKCTSESPKGKNDRVIDWSSSWLEMMTGEILKKVHLQKLKTQTSATLVLQDGRPNTAHSHEHLWDLTPQPQMLGRLPQGYSLHTALADEVDNALQAVWGNATNKRLISVDLSPDCISIFDSGPGMDASVENSIEFWGTLGRTKHREKNRDGVGGQPPFLTPYLGKYGAGGVAAALHLGRCVKVSSKTVASKRVVTLVMDLQGFEDRSDTNGNLWKTMGSFREMTDDEREKAPHGSFTKVEITHLKDQYCITTEAEHRNYWKVARLKRQLKDIYYLYIQSDDGISSKMTCPVSFVVNNQDLLEVTDCEISISNMHTCNGEPFVCDMEFTRVVDGSRQENVTERAHLRFKCDYFPNIRGRETLQEVLEKLGKLDKDYPHNFETMPRVGVRWLGRLLPDAKWPVLPFMEVTDHKQGDVLRMWTRRVKAFIETDAGFYPTQSKTELEKDHPFTVALRRLGASHDTIGVEAVRVRVKYMDKPLAVEELPKVYMRWLRKMHEEFDNEVIFLDQPTFIFHQQSLRELKVTKQAAILHKKMTYNGDCIWDIRDVVPIRLKFGRGCPGIKGPLWATLEYFYCGGVEDEKGELQTVCRPIEVADEDGSKLEEVDGQCIFHIRRSLCFSFTTLVSDKSNRVDENEWNNQLKKYGDTSPEFLEVLNKEDSEHFGLKQALPPSGTSLKAGYTLPEELLVVVRPRKGNGPSFKKGRIISEPMKVALWVTFKPSGVSESRSSKAKDIEETEQFQDPLHHTVSQSIIHPSGVKGLYSFRTKGTNVSRLIRKGEYTFRFELISDDYRLVEPALCVLKVEAADGRPRWSLCNHLGPCNERHCLSIRLNEQLKQALCAQKFDEYGNIQPLEKLEAVKLVIVGRKGELLEMSTTRSIADPEITVKERQSIIIIKDLLFYEGNLTAIQPDREALLQLYLHGEKVAEADCSVFPGDISSVELISGTPFKIIFYHPLEIMQQLTIQARDKFGNNAARGQKLTVILDGIEFVNGSDSCWEVDENGQFQLGGSLKVTAPFNRKGTIRIRSSDSSLDFLELQVNVVIRFLRTCGKWPSKVYCGRQLEGLLVEVVDEQGRRDNAVNGTGLAVSWVPNATFNFTQGVCALPTIHFPRNPRIWVGTAFLENNHDITLRLEVEVGMAVAVMLVSLPNCGPIRTKSGEPFALRFRTVDEHMQSGILTHELKAGLAVSICSQQSPEVADPLRNPKDQIPILELTADAGTCEALLTLSRETGTYFLKLSHVGREIGGMVEWKVFVDHGKLSKLVPFLTSTEGKPQHNKVGIWSLQVAARDLFPYLVIELLDSDNNLCIRYDTGVVNLLCRHCPEWKPLSAKVRGGKAVFEEFVMPLDPGNYEAYFEMSVTETGPEFQVPIRYSIALEVILGNYPSQLTIEAEPAIEICLSETVPQFLPETVVTVHSPDGQRLKNRVKLVTKVLNAESDVAEGTEREIICYHASNSNFSEAMLEQSKRHCGNSKYICNGLPVPLKTGKYFQVIYLDDPTYHVDPISRPFLLKPGPPDQIAMCQKRTGEELQQLEVKVVDTYGNICSESSGKLALSLTLDKARNFPRSDSISEPCHILSRSTGDLVAGVCRFDKFEISTGIEGMYDIRVFCEVRTEHVISSAPIRVLVTSGNIVHSVLERFRKLQSLTQELKTKAQEMTQVHEDLVSLNDRLARVQKKIGELNEDVTKLREQEGRLKAIHLKDEQILELLDHAVRTRQDVQKAIEKLPWPLSSPLNMCKRMRKSDGNSARANPIFDMVIMLAEVEDSRLNSVLSVYLGDSNLLMVVCETRKGLHELTSVFNEWDGRCEVICLEEYSDCCRVLPVATSHPQQLLQLSEPSWNGGKRPRGFLGFAVNLIHLKCDHLHLRRTLFYYLLGEAQVYDTEENMRMGLKNLSRPPGAMSLDGALVKEDPNQHQLGRGDPTISFPSVTSAERTQCSLLPPACHAFEREKRWNALGKQILDRLTDIESCKEQKSDIGMQITELENIFILQKEDHNEMHDMVNDLVDEVHAIKPVAELIHPRLGNEENQIRVFLVARGVDAL